MKHFLFRILRSLPLLGLLSPISAQTLVTNTGDAGVGTLREAISAATPGETITFDSALSGQVITLTSGQLTVDKSLSIDASALPGGITIDGNGDGTPGSSRVLEIGPHGGTNTSANIIFVTKDIYVEAEADSAPDKGYTDLLMANGHQVTRWASRDNPTPADAATLNAADLIILSRTVSSNHYRQNNEAEFWNVTVTTPLITLSGFTTRRTRLGWTENQNIEVATSDIGLYRIEEPHPVFAGFPWENGDQEPIVMSYARLLEGHQGVSINTNRPVGGRTIAAVATTGPGADGPAITEYFPGAVLAQRSSSDPSSKLTLSGHRMAFLTGSEKSDTDPLLHAGQYDLTPAGETLFLNCVRYLADPATVTLDSIAITGGDRAIAGGGILNNGANLTLNNVVITGNDANDGGGIQTVGILTMNRCSVYDNAASPSGRGVQGGGIANYGKLVINDSIIHQNGKSDAIGGGLKNGMTGIVTINRSALYANKAERGAGIFNNGTLKLNNTTLNGNTAQESGGALFNFGRFWTINACGPKGGELFVNQTTIAGNTAGTLGGGGIQNANNGSIRLQNTLIAENVSSTGPDIHYTPVTNNNPISIDAVGINLLSDLDSSTLTGGPSVLVSTPSLEPLNDNGGPTPTMALLPGSPAIDGASSTAFDTDQRGFPRPLGSGPDIGAYEFGETTGYAAWAASLPSGADTSFAGDADQDGLGNGAEYALGTDGGTFDRSSAAAISAAEIEPGNVAITFGYDNAAASDTAWVLKRTTNLTDYTEIYRYDGPSSYETIATGISATNDGTAITVTDNAPAETQVFYQFVAEPSS